MKFCKEQYGKLLELAAEKYALRASVLAGIMKRETDVGRSPLLRDGKGDSGHGHGLMQIDDRSFPEFCASSAWRDPAKNIMMGAKVLAGKRRYLRDKAPAEDLERCAVAAYNCGEGTVAKALKAGVDPDTRTAHGDYARSVLEFAREYERFS